jgi:hypothetical protein
VAGLADLANVTAGDWVAFTTAVDVAVTAGPDGGVPDAVPVLLIAPPLISAWVVT